MNKPDDSKKEKLERYLLENIPISAAMGVKVESASTQKIVLWAPLSNNINHKKTVFGGSLHAVATLACWSLLHVNLDSIGCDSHYQIVIASSQINYFAPIAEDFKANCTMAAPVEWDRFIKILLKKGKSRLNLTAKIYNNKLLCVDYFGTFVAIRQEK